MSRADSSPGRTYSFGGFTVDLDAGRLERNGEEIPLRPKSFQVLAYLVEHRGRVATKSDLMDAVWPDVAVTENSLAQCVADIRRALDDEPPQMIRSVARRGYVFSPPPPAPVKFPGGEAAGGLRLLAPRVTSRRNLFAGAGVLVLLAGATLAGVIAYRSKPKAIGKVTYTQITNFTDSVVAPALSPDGRMVVFLRGDAFFSSPDQIYIKMLPDGEPIALTKDPRNKYAPAFSPDGTQVAFSLRTADTRDGFATYIVSSLGGEPRLLLPNATGLTWLDRNRLLYSEVKTGMHMGIVSSTESRSEHRDLYWPADVRGMAHFSYPSPDRKWALVVEMNPEWLPCRLLPLDGSSPGRRVGPDGGCTSAGWSPDGEWMYFGAEVNGNNHLWRARFPDGAPEQITSGASEEEGIAVAPDGRSLITSVGIRQSELWVHDRQGERRISSEGFVPDFSTAAGEWFGGTPRPSGDGRGVYYLVRRGLPNSPRSLWHADLASGQSTEILPGVSMQEFDVSGDGKYVTYSVRSGDKVELWVAALDRASAPAMIASGVGATASPRFAADDSIWFRDNEGGTNYLFRMNRDGSGRAKGWPEPISTIQRVSPDRRWILTMVPKPGEQGRTASHAIPMDGGSARPVCADFCRAAWSADGRYLYFSLRRRSMASGGKTVVIPIPRGEVLPRLPQAGIATLADAMAIPGSRVVERADIVPGLDVETYAYVKKSVHRNLFRIGLP